MGSTFADAKTEVKQILHTPRKKDSQHGFASGVCSDPMKPQQMITELTAAKVKLREIAAECGFSTPSMVHDLKTGRRTNCSYDQGTKLAGMHRRVMRRVKAAAEAQSA